MTLDGVDQIMNAVHIFDTAVVERVNSRRVYFSQWVGRRDEGSGLDLFVREHPLESALGGSFASEILAHEALVVVSWEVWLIKFESAGLSEGLNVVALIPGLVMFGLMGVYGAYGTPHNNINSQRVMNWYG